jgi:DNA-binding response OmpR family regulator
MDGLSSVKGSGVRTLVTIVYIVILTSKEEKIEKIEGLEAGAVDL